MELKATLKKLSENTLKYKYVVLVLVVGILLMSLPIKSKKLNTVTENTPEIASTDDSVEDKLSRVLSYIDGVGEVRVFLTESRGVETIYQTDEDHTSEGDSVTGRIETVTVTDSQRNQKGLVKQINPPVYLGAIIICAGGDDTKVRLAVVDAVSKVTGLGANQISVLKMK